eukprot:3042120-Rhodomonas_salina.1
MPSTPDTLRLKRATLRGVRCCCMMPARWPSAVSFPSRSLARSRALSSRSLTPVPTLLLPTPSAPTPLHAILSQYCTSYHLTRMDGLGWRRRGGRRGGGARGPKERKRERERIP